VSIFHGITKAEYRCTIGSSYSRVVLFGKSSEQCNEISSHKSRRLKGIADCFERKSHVPDIGDVQFVPFWDNDDSKLNLSYKKSRKHVPSHSFSDRNFQFPGDSHFPFFFYCSLKSPLQWPFDPFQWVGPYLSRTQQLGGAGMLRTSEDQHFFALWSASCTSYGDSRAHHTDTWNANTRHRSAFELSLRWFDWILVYMAMWAPHKIGSLPG
jgi:hypothetical protein